MSASGIAVHVVLSAAALTLAGCNALRTPYQRPITATPSVYAHADASARVSLDEWWQTFHDPNLNELVAQAFRSNPDLALATLNIRAASYHSHLAVINPAATLGYIYEASKPLNGTGPTSQFHSLTASISYEIDFWGELAAQKDTARWEEGATVYDREAAALLLIGSVVNLYYEIADLNHQIDCGEANLTDAQKSLDLMRILKEVGGATGLDVAAVEQSLEGFRAAQSQLIEARVERRNALAVLLAGTPWPKNQERSAVPDDPRPVVDPGLPASLLDRRPDLRAAELRLRSTLSQTDAIRLSFYPNLFLTGSVGTASSGLSELVSNPLGSLAATITAPFAQWDQSHFATALARTQYDEAVVRFQKAESQALSEVDNALSARSQLAAQSTAREQAFAAARNTEQLTQLRYRAGAVSLSSYLEARTAKRSADVALSANRLLQLENYATLCLALGGRASQ